MFDIDVSGFIILAGTAVFDEVDQAAAAWRDAVGVSAEGLTPTPLTAQVLTCLMYFESEEHLIDGAEPRAVMDNWFRGPRRISDLLRTLDERGVELPPYRSPYHDIDFEPMADAFTARRFRALWPPARKRRAVRCPSSSSGHRRRGRAA